MSPAPSLNWLPGERRENLEIVLEKGVRVTGRVVDERGLAIQGARVTAQASVTSPIPARTRYSSGEITNTTPADALFSVGWSLER